MSQHPLFDVSPEHIAALDDEGLRLLIARLCEADLRSRGHAMRAAVADLDFYDRTRMATWVREYPGLILWLRERIGLPLAGWRPFGKRGCPSECGRHEM